MTKFNNSIIVLYFYLPKSDSHRVINSDTGMCYCPEVKDERSMHYTSNGNLCACGKHF